MVLNMGPILRGEINRMDICYDLTPEPVLDVTFPENAKVEGYITDDAGYMRSKSRVNTPSTLSKQRAQLPR